MEVGSGPVWASADGQAIAATELFRVHDALVARLAPIPGERWTGDSGEQIWQLTVSSDGPAKSGLAAMSRAERDELHRDWVAYFESYRGADGISAPRPYLLVVRRRPGQ